MYTSLDDNDRQAERAWTLALVTDHLGDIQQSIDAAIATNKPDDVWALCQEELVTAALCNAIFCEHHLHGDVKQ